MGGVGGGNIASEMACEYYLEKLSDSINSVDDLSNIDDKILGKFMINSISKANFEIYRESNRSPELRGMGTTLVSCVIQNKKVLIANVGDSRLYHISPEKITQVTKDHSYVQTLVDAGKISPAQAAIHPNKNIITRAVGVDTQVECDLYLITPTDGYLLLCSDGLSNYMNKDFFLSTVNSELDLSEKAKLLTDYANQCGGADNVTVVLIKL